MSQKRLAAVPLLLIFVVLANTIQPAIAYAFSPPPEITILWATHTDLDADGLNDDVFVIVLTESPSNASLTIWFIITTPSGNTVTTDTYNFMAEQFITVQIFQLLDTVSEPGWYSITAYLICDGETVTSNTFHFDPNGGVPGPPT